MCAASDSFDLPIWFAHSKHCQYHARALLAWTKHFDFQDYAKDCRLWRLIKLKKSGLGNLTKLTSIMKTLLQQVFIFDVSAGRIL